LVEDVSALLLPLRLSLCYGSGIEEGGNRVLTGRH
jgi:hypothetical protein